MGVDPDDAARLAGRCAQPRERAERDRVVAAQHERQRPLRDDVPDERRERGARLEDLGEEARALVADRERLGLGHDEVAPVDDAAAERRQPLLETGVADRGRSHVHAASTLSEVERRADDGHGPGRRGHGTGGYPPVRSRAHPGAAIG